MVAKVMRYTIAFHGDQLRSARRAKAPAGEARGNIVDMEYLATRQLAIGKLDVATGKPAR